MCLRLSFQAITNRYFSQNPIALAVVCHASIPMKSPNSNDIQATTALGQSIPSMIGRRTKCQSKRVVTRTSVCCIIIGGNRVCCGARRITRWAQYSLTISTCPIEIKSVCRKRPWDSPVDIGDVVVQTRWYMRCICVFELGDVTVIKSFCNVFCGADTLIRGQLYCHSTIVWVQPVRLSIDVAGFKYLW